MANFSNAIRRGIALAVEKDRESNEINSILSDLNEQLRDFSNESLQLVIDRAEIIALYIDRVDDNYYQRLKIAEVHTNVGGYPCKIFYNNEEFTCADGKTFQQVMVDRISTAEVGKELLKNLNNA